MTEAGKLKISPKGSMVSREAVEDKVREAEAQRKSVEGAQKQQDESRTDEDQKRRDKEIDELLPSSVFTVFNDNAPVLFATFKEIYAELWEQVADKTHLARGFCDYRFELLDVKLRVRTFRTSEGKALQMFVPPPQDSVDNYSDFIKKQMQFRDARVLIGLMEYDGTELPDLGPLLCQFPSGEWFEQDIVKRQMAWLDNQPEVMIETISGVIADVTRAHRLALRENLKNQLALRLRS